ncbi:MAG: hypothetical protein J0M20_16655, partial [Burkholderiales bacterium]|nr:hypothetical protein [Burkholderiales bacterium]
MRRTEGRWLALVVVALLHAVLFLGLQLQLWRRPPQPVAVPALQWVALPPLPSLPPRPARTAGRPAQGKAPAPHAAPSMAPPPSIGQQDISLRLVDAAVEPPQPPASAASQSRPSLLDHPASRQALRTMAQRPLLSERAAQAMGDGLQRSDEALGQGIQRAAKGDCLHGEFAGAGMGLLSLPALAVAAARG